MENTVAAQSPSDLLNIEFTLNSATWEVGIALTPTLAGCDEHANASDAEVLS
jgi:hypothetical protein